MEPADPDRQVASSDGLPLALWTLGQAGVVALYAAGLKPAAGYPAPPEATADLGLAVAQLVLAVCFAPELFVDRGRIARVAAIGLAWTALAAVLAGRSIGQTVPLVVVTVSWLAAVAVWRRQPAVRLVLAFLTLAGPVLFYVALEYGSRPFALGSGPTLLSPPLGATATRLHNALFWPVVPPLLLCFGRVFGRFSSLRTSNDTSEK